MIRQRVAQLGEGCTMTPSPLPSGWRAGSPRRVGQFPPAEFEKRVGQQGGRVARWSGWANMTSVSTATRDSGVLARLRRSRLASKKLGSDDGGQVGQVDASPGEELAGDTLAFVEDADEEVRRRRR